MSDVRTILKRGVGGAAPPPDGFQRMLRRRDRKRRNQRIRAGALGLLIAAAAVAVILQVTGSDPVPVDLTPAPELSPSPTTPEDVDRLADLGIGTYFVNVRTGEAVPMASSITSIPGAGNYDVSPDGTRILFDNQGALHGPASDGPVEPRLLQLFVANIDGSDVRQLTDEPLGASLGSWSPDGTKVVYVGGWAGPQRLPAELTVMDVATGSTTRLREGPAMAFQDPFFSADGNEILFTRPGSIPTPDGEPQADLWTIPVDGGEPHVVLGDRGYAAYSPDGATIVFPRMVVWSDGHNSANYYELWISDADGSDARRLASTGGFGGQGRWSPDGKLIFYGSYGPPRFTRGPVWVLDMTTGRSTVLSAGRGQDWVDDETLIVVNQAL